MSAPVKLCQRRSGESPVRQKNFCKGVGNVADGVCIGMDGVPGGRWVVHGLHGPWRRRASNHLRRGWWRWRVRDRLLLPRCAAATAGQVVRRRSCKIAFNSPSAEKTGQEIVPFHARSRDVAVSSPRWSGPKLGGRLQKGNCETAAIYFIPYCSGIGQTSRQQQAFPGVQPCHSHAQCRSG